MPTYLHTYIPKNPTNPTYYYRQTYRLMPTNEHIQTYNSTSLHPYIHITLPYNPYPTLQTIPYSTPTNSTQSCEMKTKNQT